MTNVSDEIRNALMEAAAWDRVGVEPTYLNEASDDDEEAAESSEEEQEGAAEEAPEEAADDDSEDDSEDDSLEEASNAELLAALLSEMSDDELMDHINSVMDVVDQAAEALHEEEDEAEGLY